MNMKQAKAAFKQPFDGDSVPTCTHLRISGLREIEPGVFELDGIKPRRIDHDALARALGYESDPELEDKVLSTVWRFDMVRLLTDRIEA